ncbi:hypothetical protein [Mucilaginibacter sp. UYCu711]|uniref:hypothetical protein n=1 Tax=Mucilaginibacter sp. UYCu711 TaxID=3156339 RepID=UPI003D1D8354
MAQRLKRFSTSFKVIVITGILLVAAYTIKLFTTGAKEKILAEQTVVAENHPVKKHRKKHRLKRNLAKAKKGLFKKDTVKVVTPNMVTLPRPAPAKVTVPNIVAVPKPEPVKAVVPNIVTVPKPAPAKPVLPVTPLSAKLPAENNTGFLYTTYVHPNVTGIVKMRQEDKFASNIIADIPANAKVQVLQKGQMYYRVAYNNSIGFVPKWSLQDK